MRDALVDNRLTLDESSLNFRGIDRDEVEALLDQLNETMGDIRRQGLSVSVHPWLWNDVECLDGVSVCDFVYASESSYVSKDTLRLLGVLLDRCPSWREDEPGLVESVDVTPVASVDAPQGSSRAAALR